VQFLELIILNMQKNEFLQCKKIRIIFPVIIFLFTCSLYSATGSLWGKQDLRVTKTQWFDIIYTPKSSALAAVMYENADRIYEEVAGQYDMVPEFRMPMVITPGVDNLNAFWTSAPYNHIVIYDTSIAEIGELSTYSETLLSVFRHELTHAVTNNMKNKEWKRVTKIFGDPLVPGMLLVSTGISEGATLTSESADGEGRLNDEYAKHPVKQAKIEGKFPSYYDVKGSSDKYPYGSAYYFNGAFHQWLQDNYGMEAYAKFWFNVVNGKKTFINSNFKLAFGVGIKEAWKKFAEEYSVPEINSNPLSVSEVKDFFVPDSEKYSRLNNSGSRYASLCSSNQSVFWIDSSCNKVQTVPVSKIGEKSVKPKTLFSLAGLEEISVSKDERFMAVSFYSQNGAGTKALIKIYDLKKKKFVTVKESGLKNGAIIQYKDDYYLVANKYESPDNYQVIKKLVFKDDKLVSVEDVSKTVQKMNTFNFEYTQLEDGKFAYIKKEGLDYSICVQNINNVNYLEYNLPEERMVVASLSGNGDKLYFSWTVPDSMPALGILDTKDGSVFLSDKELSGGVFEPVAIPDLSEIVYIGHFYKQNRLFAGDFSQHYDEVLDAQEISASEIETAANKEKEQLPELEYENYKSIDYIKRGLFIPFSAYETEYFGKNSTYTSGIASYILGATYITSNPWSNGSNDLYQLTGGWNYLNNSFGIGLTANLGTDTQLFTSAIDVKNEFDSNGWKLSSGKLSLSGLVYIGNITYFTYINESAAKIGRQDVKNKELTMLDEFRFWDSSYFNCCSPSSDTIYTSLSNLLTIGISNVHKINDSRYNKAGVTALLGAELRKDDAITGDPVTYINNFNLYPVLKAYIPGLFPIRLNYELLPLQSIYGYTNNSYKAGRSIMDFKAETILFGREIQRSVPFLSALYLNDIYISMGYAFTLGTAGMEKVGFQLSYLPDYISGALDNKGKVLDSVYLKVALELTPNLGLFANSAYKMNFYTMISYTMNGVAENKLPLNFFIGTTANF